MGRYLLLALNSPTRGEGDEDEYNEWYNATHKSDLLSVDGSRSVRRFKILHRDRIEADYISVTEFDAEDPDAVMRQLAERAHHGQDGPELVDVRLGRRARYDSVTGARSHRTSAQ
jgi:hypothetical protein